MYGVVGTRTDHSPYNMYGGQPAEIFFLDTSTAKLSYPAPPAPGTPELQSSRCGITKIITPFECTFLESTLTECTLECTNEKTTLECALTGVYFPETVHSTTLN